MLMTKSWLLTSMIWCDNANLLYLKYGEISDDFFLKIKQSKFLDGIITYQSHMSISMLKTFYIAFLVTH
jgi:hypothetical protein